MTKPKADCYLPLKSRLWPRTDELSALIFRAVPFEAAIELDCVAVVNCDPHERALVDSQLYP
jgi:hypothetical protein